MTEKQNYLEAITFGDPDYVPYVFSAIKMVGMIPNFAIERPIQEGDDAFGVHWLLSPDGSMPDNSHFLLDEESVTEWRDIIKIPDLEQYPWEMWAKQELEGADHENKAFYTVTNNGIFDRLVALMGFTDGLCAMISEPEAVYDLLGALTDYKVDLINHLCKYYHPDVIQYVDDVATASGLFMSPDLYREMLKPHESRIIAAIRENGAIAEHHCCGRCEDIIDDFVEMGVQIWFPAQIVNDVKGIKDKYKGKLVISHGLDSQGVFSKIDVAEEDIRKDVRRAVDEYAEGGGLTIFPVLLGGDLQKMQAGTERRGVIVEDELKKYGRYH